MQHSAVRLLTMTSGELEFNHLLDTLPPLDALRNLASSTSLPSMKLTLTPFQTVAMTARLKVGHHPPKTPNAALQLMGNPT